MIIIIIIRSLQGTEPLGDNPQPKKEAKFMRNFTKKKFAPLSVVFAHSKKSCAPKIIAKGVNILSQDIIFIHSL